VFRSLISAISSLASLSPLKGGGDARLSKAAAEARMVPGDLLLGVMIVSFFPLIGDSCSSPIESPLRNGGMKLGERNPACLCEAEVCGGAGLCEGVGDLGSPAIAPLILSNILALITDDKTGLSDDHLNGLQCISAEERKLQLAIGTYA
jgi:hypothetical protein